MAFFPLYAQLMYNWFTEADNMSKTINLVYNNLPPAAFYRSSDMFRS